MLRGAAYGSNVYRWADGGGEAVVYFDHAAGSDLPDRGARAWGVRGAAVDPERSRIESCRRARGRVRRLARHGDYRFMWTLTAPGRGLQGLDGAWEVFQAWMMGKRGRLRSSGASKRLFGGAYLAFAEKGTKGTHRWHIHVLTNRHIDVNALRVSWSAHLGVAHARVGVKRFDAARSAASYAAKYVSKAFDGGPEFGRHRYRVGEGVEAPVPAYAMILGADVWEAAYTVLEPFWDARPRICKVSGAGPPAIWAGW